MIDGNDALIQTASGLWIPKQTRFYRDQQAQQPQQGVQQDPKPVRDWVAHWKVQGQPWRQEPEIDQERQQFLRQRLEIELNAQNIYPFQDISLTRADLEWLIQEHKEKSVGDVEQQQRLNLSKTILGAINCALLPLEGVYFGGAQLEGATFRDAQLEGVTFGNAQLQRATFWRAQLEGANFGIAQLEGADFWCAHLEGANFGYAQLEEANFGYAHLEEADFGYAQLQRANFGHAHLEGADFGYAHLEGATFWRAHLEGATFRDAHLEGADFGYAHLEGVDFRFAGITSTSFEGAMIVTAQGIGPIVADVTGWDERSLPIGEWSAVKKLGDEAEAKKRRDADGNVKNARTHFDNYFAATRAYRQVATAVEGMGRKEEAEKFAFRAQVMQRKMLWWSIWQKDRQRKRTFWQRLADLRAWMFSGLLALLSGYGYRFGRSFSWYIGILLSFAWLYIHLSQSVPPHSTIPDHLSWLDACILSVSDMVGRGFFRQDVTLSDPYAGWSVLEGMIGVFMDVVLISTLTQRLFKK